MKEKMKMSSIKNIILISKNIQKMKSDTIPGTPSKSVSACFWRFVPLFVRLPPPRFLSHPYFKMLGCRTRADVATLPRCDVETSRRGDVVTWQSTPCFILHSSKNCFHSCSFRSTVPIFKTDQIMSLAIKTV